MTGQPLVRRAEADRDVARIVRHYRREAGRKVALAFVDALGEVYAPIARYPASGSPRYAGALQFPDLRFWPLARFPYLVFYVVRPERSEILRVLHARRDIPAHLQG